MSSQDRLREAQKEAAAERDAAAARQEEVQRCKAYIDTVEAKLRVHSEYIERLETSLSDAQVPLAAQIAWRTCPACLCERCSTSSAACSSSRSPFCKR